MMKPNRTLVYFRRLMIAPACAALAVSTLLAQQPAPSSSNTGTKSDNTGTNSDQEVIKMSPFSVEASSHDVGYYTQNTLAGTRLNTNIADLASSITVVTKQQLSDTNSVDLNDVFRYEASTEGASTYTPTVLARGNMVDTLSGGGGTTGSTTSYATTGNRVRGLAAVDNQQDNFFSVSRIPFDSYNTQSVEIDRGPNSILFGTGSPAGILNQSRSKAVLDKFGGEVSLTGGSWGTFRETIGLNLPLIHNKLAIYVAQTYLSKGFMQKPSSDLTRRQYAAFTFEPFKNKKTRLSGSFENYNNYANDPNTVTPMDYVSPWLASGRPVYNPVTSTVTYLNSGVTVGPYVVSTTSPNYVAGGPTQALLTTSTSPYFVPSMSFNGHTIMTVSQGNVENFFKGQQTGYSITNWMPAVNALTLSQYLVYQERWTQSTNLPVPTQYSNWAFPSVVSKDIYDWSTINLSSLSHTQTRAKTYYLDLQQEILPNLNLNLGWFRQEVKQQVDSLLAQASATALNIDTNSYLPMGQPNPHVGQPFVGIYGGFIYDTPETNNNLRATLAYDLDLKSKVPGWLQWLGHHRFAEVFSQHDDVKVSYFSQNAITGGDPNYLPTDAALNAVSGYGYYYNNTGATEQWLYLGGRTGLPNGHGTMSPGFLDRADYGGPTTIPISTYNYTTGKWETTTVEMHTGFREGVGGTTQNLQDTKSFIWQSFFWNDRINGLIGINSDQVKNRNTIWPATNPQAIEYPNHFPDPSLYHWVGPWTYVSGKTKTTAVVAHLFKNWARLDAAADRGNVLAAMARTISFTFNKSDNFNPPEAYYTDFFGKPLGKPQGADKNYGVQIATPDNKLFLRATWFKTTNENQLIASTAQGRARYVDGELQNWATAVVEVRNGQNPSDPNFGNTSIYPITQAMQTQIAALEGMPYGFGGNVGQNGQYINVGKGSQSSAAKGTELELVYNPTPSWTMKFTWSKQVTTVDNLGGQATGWLNYRIPFYQAAVASDLGTIYTKSNGTPMFLGNFWGGYGFDGNITANNLGGTSNGKQYYDVIVDPVLAADKANNGGKAPNQREYTWRYLTNYNFDHGFLKGFAVGGAVRYDGRATAGYYGNPKVRNSNGQIAGPDINNPIYTMARYHIDAWVSYRFVMPGAKIRGRVQLNVADMTSNGYLLPVSYNWDGSPAAQRIIQPRAFSLTTTFQF